jgi:hypothetical protein
MDLCTNTGCDLFALLPGEGPAVVAAVVIVGAEAAGIGVRTAGLAAAAVGGTNLWVCCRTTDACGLN